MVENFKCKFSNPKFKFKFEMKCSAGYNFIFNITFPDYKSMFWKHLCFENIYVFQNISKTFTSDKKFQKNPNINIWKTIWRFEMFVQCGSEGAKGFSLPAWQSSPGQVTSQGAQFFFWKSTWKWWLVGWGADYSLTLARPKVWWGQFL